MNRRKGIVAALGVLASTMIGQDREPGRFILTASPNPEPIYFGFSNEGLTVRYKGREAKISADEIMDALEGKA